jgi:hypothetical protein
MIFPIYTSSQPPSPRVQELGQRIALAIAEFQQRNPDLSAEEVRAAAQLATQQVDAPRGVPRRALAAAGAGVVAVGLGTWLATGPAGGHLPLGAIAAGLAAVVAIIAVANRRS